MHFVPSYCAFIGHQPQISLAELSAVLPDFTMSHVVDKNIVFFETSRELSEQFLDEVGGTMVIAEQITQAPVSWNDIPKLLKNEVKDARKKVTFGLRTHGIPKQKLQDLYKQCKRTIKDTGRPCRYVGNERKATQPVVLHEAEMLDGKHGCELVIIMLQSDDTPRTTLLSSKAKEDNGASIDAWIGRTVDAHDVDSFAWRDMEKPVRDTTVGLLPPKLALMMLNFGAWLAGDAGSESTPTVYDPFCGTGVIPMEALLKGWDIWASDISQKAVNGCTKNIEWLRKEESILKKDVFSEIFKHDATVAFDLDEPPDVIVTETSLGPPMTKRATQRDCQKLANESETLQKEFLTNAKACFPDTPIVCIWPAWRQANHWVHLTKIWDKLGDIGYEAVLPPGTPIEDSQRPTLFYRRPDQFVGREIVLLKPTK